MPDLLGQPLERATRSLEAAGWRVRVIDTAPPGGAPGPGRRVVRQRQAADGAVELTAAAQIELREP